MYRMFKMFKLYKMYKLYAMAESPPPTECQVHYSASALSLSCLDLSRSPLTLLICATHHIRPTTHILILSNTSTP